MKKNYFLIILFLIFIGNTFAQKKQTYKSNGTTYYSNDIYKTTGQPKVRRNSTEKKEFLKSKGYNNVPQGYQVDHIKPLSEGGSDKSTNMQLITTEEHKAKTANERKEVSKTNTTFNNPNYNSNSSYSAPIYNSSYSPNPNLSRTIYTGSKGGQYYYSSNGNKIYIKRK